MTSVDSVIPVVGLIIVVNSITVTSGRGRRTTTRLSTQTSFGSGFIVDGTLENGMIRDASSTDVPVVVSVAHIIPTQGTTRYFFKLFDQITKLPKIYELNLISYNRAVDVAVFDFINDISNNMMCLQFNHEEVLPGERCYVVGYPLGDAQLSIAEGNVRDPTYCFSDLASGVDQIYHSVPVTNGNSGSCILNKDNKIIGIHAWGYFQNSTTIGYENFSGGPSTHCLYCVISYMLNNRNLAINKYQPRFALGIHAQIIGDVFKINAGLNNQNIQSIDGVLVERIIPNTPTNQYTIDTYNKLPGTTTKIEVNDIITHIYTQDDIEIPLGYTASAPVNLLFGRPNVPIKLKVLKNIKNPQNPFQYEQTPREITINTTYFTKISDDGFYSRLI